MNDPTLKNSSVQIKYDSDDGYCYEETFESEEIFESGNGLRRIIPAEPHRALIDGIDELARICAMFGHEAEARAAVEDAFSRVAVWRAEREGGAA